MDPVAKSRSDQNTQEPRQQAGYDLWLDKFSPILEASRSVPIIDLGCGSGNDSLYLAERGYQVIACDISETAINSVRSTVPTAQTMIFDMLDGLPFGDASAKLVIADLCLHYFSWADTVRITEEIKRVLCTGGYLLCRLNSVNDLHFGAGRGLELEENYYALEGGTKRFFDKTQLEQLFASWTVKSIRECGMDRYKKPKTLWELALQK